MKIFSELKLGLFGGNNQATNSKVISSDKNIQYTFDADEKKLYQELHNLNKPMESTPKPR